MSRTAIVVALLMLIAVGIGGVAGYLSVEPAQVIASESKVVEPTADASDPTLAPKQPADSSEPDMETAEGRAEKYGPDWTACSLDDDLQFRIVACNRLLKDVPLRRKHRAWAYNNRGAAYYLLHDYGPAVQSYQQAIATDQTDPNAHFNLGDVALMFGRPREALILFDKAIDLGMEKASVYCQKAKALRVLGKLNAASAVLDKVSAAEAEETCVLRQRGEIALARGQADEAVAHLRKAESDPVRASTAQCRAGEVLRNQGRLEEAFQAYTKGVELNPDNKCAIKNAGGLIIGLRPFDEAVAMLDSNFARHPDLLELQCYKALAMERNFQSRQAFELYERVLADHPAESCSLFSRARLLFRMGESDKALAAYDAALKIVPNDAVGWEGRGQVNIHFGNIERALKDFGTALKLEPDRVSALQSRGELLLLTRQYEPALRDFAHIDALRPGERIAGLYLAEAQLALGNTDATLNRCRALTNADASDYISRRCGILRARAYLMRDDPAQAVPELAAVAEEEGPRSEANLYLTALHLLAGERELAVAALARFRSKRPDDLYGALWAALTVAEGEAPPPDLDALAAKQDIWPLPLLRHVMGLIDESAVRSQTAVPDFNLAALRAAEAEFYIGLKLLLDGHPDAAGKFFRRLEEEAPIVLSDETYPGLYKHSNRMELALASWLDRR
jgi:tetratricopeptide (TPR) repeat protein